MAVWSDHRRATESSSGLAPKWPRKAVEPTAPAMTCPISDVNALIAVRTARAPVGLERGGTGAQARPGPRRGEAKRAALNSHSVANAGDALCRRRQVRGNARRHGEHNLGRWQTGWELPSHAAARRHSRTAPPPSRSLSAPTGGWLAIETPTSPLPIRKGGSRPHSRAQADTDLRPTPPRKRCAANPQGPAAASERAPPTPTDEGPKHRPQPAQPPPRPRSPTPAPQSPDRVPRSRQCV